jgi:hypothetical protein
LDPVVLTGADIPFLTEVPPDDLVAFRFNGRWDQVAVQVDERAEVDFGRVYGTAASGVTTLAYVDVGTFTGADPNPDLDRDDEVVFMAKDAGDRALPPGEPDGVAPGSGVEVEVLDPLDGRVSYVYLFRTDRSLSQDAGQSYVSYEFNLLSGSYLDTYRTVAGPNPEDSAASTQYYSHHFSDRWVSEDIRITAGSATGVDILDRHKALFRPGDCTRSEDTFSLGGGAFIANKNGPVRAIRSYIGANSGPLSQRDHIFYERREDIRSYLRVHPILGIMDFFDYSPEAIGMTYFNDLNSSGVVIDGEPDFPEAGAIRWELVEGPQGSVVSSSAIETNLSGFSHTSYYADDATPADTQCTGDEFAYGSSGLWFDDIIPCTDPALGCTDILRGYRTLYFAEPGVSPAQAAAADLQARTPLEAIIAPYGSQEPPTPTVSGSPTAVPEPMQLPPAGSGPSDNPPPLLPWLALGALTAGFVGAAALLRRLA